MRGRNHVIGVVMGGRTARRRDQEMMNLLDATFAQIQVNPMLVASATVPWKSNFAQNNSTVVAGFDLTPPSARGAQLPQAVVADAEDEDAA